MILQIFNAFSLLYAITCKKVSDLIVEDFAKAKFFVIKAQVKFVLADQYLLKNKQMKNNFADNQKSNCKVYSKSLKKMIHNRMLSDYDQIKIQGKQQQNDLKISVNQPKSKTTGIRQPKSKTTGIRQRKIQAYQNGSILGKRYLNFTKNIRHENSQKFIIDPVIIQEYEKVKQKAINQTSKNIQYYQNFKHSFLMNKKFKQLCVSLEKRSNCASFSKNSDNVNIFQKKINQIVKTISEDCVYMNKVNSYKRQTKHYRLISEPYQYIQNPINAQIVKQISEQKESKRHKHFLNGKINTFKSKDNFNFLRNEHLKYKPCSSHQKNKLSNKNRHIEARRIKTEMKNYQNQKLKILSEKQKVFNSREGERLIGQQCLLFDQLKKGPKKYEQLNLSKQIINVKLVTKHLRKGKSFAQKMFRID